MSKTCFEQKDCSAFLAGALSMCVHDTYSALAALLWFVNESYVRVKFFYCVRGCLYSPASVLPAGKKAVCAKLSTLV